MCRLAVGGASLLTALILTACSASGTAATGAIPTTQPPIATTTQAPTSPVTTEPTTPDPPISDAAPSPTPTTGDAAIFAGVQAYSDGFVAAVQQRDIAPFDAVVDPQSNGLLQKKVAGLISTLLAKKWKENYTETLTDEVVTKQKNGRACVQALSTSKAFAIVDADSGKLVEPGKADEGRAEYCLRMLGGGTWRVYSVRPLA